MNRCLQLLAAVIFLLQPISQGSEIENKEAREALETHISTIVLFKEGSAFTQKIVGDKTIPYEMKGFEYVGPRELPLTRADKENGIDRKLLFSIRISTWRSYNKASGWSGWKSGRPLGLGGISLQRKDGTWEIVSSPAANYTLQ